MRGILSGRIGWGQFRTYKQKLARGNDRGLRGLELCARVFHTLDPSWRTRLKALSSSFRQFSLKGSQSAVWGNEKDICRQIQASLICRQLPFSESLRDSRPAAHADPRLARIVSQTSMHFPEMTALAVNNAQRYSRISKSDRIELARFRSSFVLRRISGSLDKSSLFNRLAEAA